MYHMAQAKYTRFAVVLMCSVSRELATVRKGAEQAGGPAASIGRQRQDTSYLFPEALLFFQERPSGFQLARVLRDQVLHEERDHPVAALCAHLRATLGAASPLLHPLEGEKGPTQENKAECMMHHAWGKSGLQHPPPSALEGHSREC